MIKFLDSLSLQNVTKMCFIVGKHFFWVIEKLRIFHAIADDFLLGGTLIEILNNLS